MIGLADRSQGNKVDTVGKHILQARGCGHSQAGFAYTWWPHQGQQAAGRFDQTLGHRGNLAGAPD